MSFRYAVPEDTGTFEAIARLIDLQNGTLIAELIGRKNGIKAVFSPDGRRAVRFGRIG